MFLSVGLAADSVCSLSPPAGRGLGGGGVSALDASPSPGSLRSPPSPRTNSGLPEFGSFNGPKSDKSDFGWGEGNGARGEAAALLGALVLCPSKRSHRYC